MRSRHRNVLADVRFSIHGSATQQPPAICRPHQYAPDVYPSQAGVDLSVEAAVWLRYKCDTLSREYFWILMGPSISKLECASVAGPAVPRSHRSGFAGGGLDAAMLAKLASLCLAFKMFQTFKVLTVVPLRSLAVSLRS